MDPLALRVAARFQAAEEGTSRQISRAWFDISNGGLGITIYERSWYPEKGYKRFEIEVNASSFGSTTSYVFPIPNEAGVQWFIGALQRVLRQMQTDPSYKTEPAFSEGLVIQAGIKLANLFRQKGKAYRDRRRRYRQNKAKSKRESQQWRQRHRAYLRRYRQKAKRNPSQHRMRKHALVLSEDVQVWDLDQNRPGEVQDLSINDETVTVDYGGADKVYDVLDFLDRTVFMNPQDEDTMFGILDEFYHPEEDDDDDEQGEVDVSLKT